MPKRFDEIKNDSGYYSLNDTTLEFVGDLANFLNEEFDDEITDRLRNGIIGVIQFERDKALARGGVTFIKKEGE